MISTCPPSKRRCVGADRKPTQAENIDEIKKKQEEMDKKLDGLVAEFKEDRKARANEQKTTDKEFILKHTFDGVLDMADGVLKNSKLEEHFGVKWAIQITHNGPNLGVYLNFVTPKGGNWLIQRDQEMEISVANDTRYTRKISHTSGCGRGYARFLPWEEMKNVFMKNNRLEVMIRVKILKLGGIVKPKLRHFDESKRFSVILKVGDEKFYVSKEHLANQSEYFERMFYGGCKESKQEEVPLQIIDAQDFQNFLEALYGDPVIDDYTLEGILFLNDMYRVASVRRFCEEFLASTKCGKILKKKLGLTARYQLTDLMKKFISRITTREEIKAIIGGNVDDVDTMESPLANALLKKSLTLP